MTEIEKALQLLKGDEELRRLGVIMIAGLCKDKKEFKKRVYRIIKPYNLTQKERAFIKHSSSQKSRELWMNSIK